jgi:signal transduction histidine kinase
MRCLVGTLRAEDSGPLAPTATIDDIRILAERSSVLGLPVRLHLDGVEELPAAVAPSIHRVAGESITNAQRHAAGATAVDVHLRSRGGQLTLEVLDDGQGARGTRHNGPGFGLTGMAERTEALGGRFEAGPTPGGGWRIRALFPLGAA